MMKPRSTKTAVQSPQPPTASALDQGPLKPTPVEQPPRGARHTNTLRAWFVIVSILIVLSWFTPRILDVIDQTGPDWLFWTVEGFMQISGFFQIIWVVMVFALINQNAKRTVPGATPIGKSSQQPGTPPVSSRPFAVTQAALFSIGLALLFGSLLSTAILDSNELAVNYAAAGIWLSSFSLGWLGLILAAIGFLTGDRTPASRWALGLSALLVALGTFPFLIAK